MATKKQDLIESIDVEELTHVSGGTDRGNKPVQPGEPQPPRRPSFGRVINGMLGGGDK
jgi:hypothetical protein